MLLTSTFYFFPISSLVCHQVEPFRAFCPVGQGLIRILKHCYCIYLFVSVIGKRYYLEFVQCYFFIVPQCFFLQVCVSCCFWQNLICEQVTIFSQLIKIQCCFTFISERLIVTFLTCLLESNLFSNYLLSDCCIIITMLGAGNYQ